MYNYDQGNDTILFNNKDIMVDGKPQFIRECFIKGIHTIQQLFNENGQYLTFQEFQAKYNNINININIVILISILISLQHKLSPVLSNLECNSSAFEEQSESPRDKFGPRLQRKLEIIFAERKLSNQF